MIPHVMPAMCGSKMTSRLWSHAYTIEPMCNKYVYVYVCVYVYVYVCVCVCVCMYVRMYGKCLGFAPNRNDDRQHIIIIIINNNNIIIIIS